MIKISNTKLRIIYWGAFLLFMVLVVFPLFFFFYLFDENKVKHAIIDQFDNKNYNVEIYGGIVPKIWHGMSLDISGVLITTKNANELIRIRRMSCKLSWLDLVIGRYNVNRVAIKGMEVNEDSLKHYGIPNLLNISNKQNSFFNIEQLEIYNIDSVGKNVLYPISDGTIQVEEDGIGAKFNLGFKSLKNDTYYSINGSASSLKKNSINFDNFNVHIYNVFSNIDVAAKAKYLITDKVLLLDNVVGNLQIKSYTGALNIAQVRLGLDNAHAYGASLQVDYSSNFINHHILLDADNIYTLGYNNLHIDKFHSQYKSGIANFSFDIDTQVESLSYSESRGVYSDLCANRINFSSSKVKNDGLNAVLKGTCRYDVMSDAFAFGLSGNLNDMPVKLNLQVIKAGTKPYIIANGDISELSLSKIRFYDKKAAALFNDTNKLPFAWLSLFNAKANLNIKRFVADKIALDNVVTEFNVDNDQLNVKRLAAKVFKGDVSGSLKVIKKNDSYDIYAKQTIKNLSLKDMLSSYFDIKAISGVANMQLDASVKDAKNYNDIHKKINGNVLIEAKNGAFQGVDFNLFVNPESNSISTNRSTIFNQMQAKFKFVNGMSSNGLLEFSSPYVIANGMGKLDFVNYTLNYNLNIKSALPKNNQKISLVVIPVSVAGAISSPKVNIQNIQLIGASESKLTGTSQKKYQRTKNVKHSNKHRPRD